MRFFSVLVLMALNLVACGEDKQRTADYYRKNADERKSIIEKCDAEYKKGVRPEGNFAINCATARQVDSIELQNAIRNKLETANQ